MLEYVLFATLALAQTTDQTVPVQKGTRLDINNFAGDVKIVAWDRDAVRVEATTPIASRSTSVPASSG